MVLCASVAAAVAQMHAKGAGLLVVFAMPPPPPPGASNSAGESPADHYARVAGAAMARHTLPGAAAALSAAGAVGVVVFAGTADAAALTRRYGPPPRLPATYFIAANGELRGVAGGYLSPDEEKTLAELGLVPSAVLVATPLDATGGGGGGGGGPAAGVAAAVGGAASVAATGVATAAATVGGWLGWAAARVGGGGGGGGGGNSVPAGGAGEGGGGVIDSDGPPPPPPGGGREMRQLPMGGLRHRPAFGDGQDDGSVDYWNGNGTTFGARDAGDADAEEDADAPRRGWGGGRR
ncbi:hypothetical protein I4F81_001013 [Pyropia yezoensis]|uniref:Uncharacterized protein n=1 Tax=Pyropia yezoensis TaxID=2788 RepID=A0ACC3BLF8_PYRYE|nr:hypothetical protein I4F81_001013 [Neopyropia yezoensis]